MKRAFIITLVFGWVAIQLSAQNDLSIQAHTFENNEGEEVASELGTFSVPENRAKPDGKEIELTFVRFKSTNPNPGSPIVYLAGGPGGSGILTAKGPRFKLFMALREVADVIAFDQRGTGLSNHIPTCESNTVFPMDKAGSPEYYAGEMKETMKSCMDFWKSEGVDISAYNTRESANDLEDLRKVLNASKISLWGISYGSHLGFEFIKNHEPSVDKVVLVGLEGPDQSIKLPSLTDGFLKNLSTKLEEDEAASAQYPDLVEMMSTVMERFDGKPMMVKAQDPRSGAAFEVTLSKFDVQLVTSFLYVKNPSDSKNLPRAFKKMYDGDFTEMALMVAGLRQQAGRVRAMPFAMDAMSGISEKRWKRVQREARKAILGRSTNFPFPDLAQGLGLPDLGDEFRTNPESKVEALFFSGTLDGRTFIPSAKELVKGFKNGTHIIIDGAGHDMFMSTPEVEARMLKFFKGEPFSKEKITIPVPAFTLMN